MLISCRNPWLLAQSFVPVPLMALIMTYFSLEGPTSNMANIAKMTLLCHNENWPHGYFLWLIFSQSVSPTCKITPWAIIVLPDTVTLISTSSLLSAVFPSVWPASANTVFGRVFACVCVHCTASSTFPGLWTCIKTQRGLATTTSKRQYEGENLVPDRSELRWEEFHFVAKSKWLLKHMRQWGTCWVHRHSHQSVSCEEWLAIQ